MNKITIKTFIQKTIDKYLEKIQHLCKDFTNRKMERIKNTIYKMVMECGVHTLRDPSGYPSGGSPLIGTVTPGPNWPFLSPP